MVICLFSFSVTELIKENVIEKRHKGHFTAKVSLCLRKKRSHFTETGKKKFNPRVLKESNKTNEKTGPEFGVSKLVLNPAWHRDFGSALDKLDECGPGDSCRQTCCIMGIICGQPRGAEGCSIV